MRYIIGLIIIALIAGAAYVIAGGDDNQDNTNTNPPPSSNNQTNENTSTDNQTPASTDKVSISNMTFSPAEITVKKDTTVTWTNNDSVTHTIEFEDASIAKSDNINNGQTFSATFNKTGSFNYNCGIHGSMQGTVTVTE